MGILYYHTDLRPFMNGNGLSVRGNPKVPFMEATIVRNESFSGLLQRYEAEDLVLRYDCFEVNKETVFLPDCRSAMILYYVLEGNAYGIHQTAADPLLDPHRHYLRGAEHINGGKFVLTAGRYRCFYIGLPEDFLHPDERLLLPSEAPTRQKELKLIEEILHCTYTGARLRAFLHARKLELWQLYLGHHGDDLQRATLQRNKLALLTEYIDSHLSDNLSDMRLAEVYGSSISVFRKAFKKHFGYASHQYVLLKRLEKAVDLLRETSIPVKEIAWMIGFADEKNLNRALVRHFYHPPTWFRNKPL